MTSLTITPAPAIARVSALVLSTVSPRSQRDYGRALDNFLAWHQETGQTGFNKAVVSDHVAYLKTEGVTDSSINQRLAAIRKLAAEAADNGLIDHSTAEAISRVPNIRRQGAKLGNWLSREQASAMLNAPDLATLKGLRDRAILAVMLGAGLRREELTSLTVEHLQQREGRWVIIDLQGKHNRTRTVPIASWIKSMIDDWVQAAGIEEGLLFRSIRKGGAHMGEAMTPQAIWYVVEQYSPVANVSPHDLRRTFAQLADRAGAPIEQIQRTLGHASLVTTERYLGHGLDLHHAPSDYIQLDLLQ